MLFYINIYEICLSVVHFIFADALISMWLSSLPLLIAIILPVLTAESKHNGSAWLRLTAVLRTPRREMLFGRG